MAAPAHRYAAVVVCRVCGVTARMLDYWVSTGVIEPAAVFECESDAGETRRRRAYHLFDIRTLVQVKIVKELRDAGVSLQRIRFAIDKLRRKRGASWQSAWIVTDGRTVYKQTDNPAVLESLAKGEGGQKAFSVIALGATYRHVESSLKECKPFPLKRFRGAVKPWSARIASA